MLERYQRFDSPLAADQELIDATLNVLVAEDPDAVSLVQLAGLLNRDLDEMQELFGHPGELLAQLWQSTLHWQLAEVIDLAERIHDGDLEALNEIGVNRSLRRAAIHLMIVSHRFEELAEVVPQDVAQMTSDLRSRVQSLDESDSPSMIEADDSVIIGLLGWVCGVLLDPGVDKEISLRQLESNHFHHRCWKTHLEPMPAKRLQPQVLVFDQDGPLSGELLMASTRIVAQGGVNRATLARVARISGFPPEVVVSMYLKQENLLSDFIQSVMTSIFGYESIKEVMVDPSNATVRLAVWLADGLVLRRRALLETLLAGSHSPSIRSAHARVVRSIDSRAESDGDDGHDIFGGHFSRYAVVVRHVCLGLAVIRDAIGDLGVTDWRPFTGIALGSDLRLGT